jgi:hypothetical protein
MMVLESDGERINEEGDGHNHGADILRPKCLLFSGEFYIYSVQAAPSENYHPLYFS